MGTIPRAWGLGEGFWTAPHCPPALCPPGSQQAEARNSLSDRRMETSSVQTPTSRRKQKPISRVPCCITLQWGIRQQNPLTALGGGVSGCGAYWSPNHLLFWPPFNMHTAKDPQTFEGKLTCAIGIHIPKQSGKVYLEDTEALQEEGNYKKVSSERQKKMLHPWDKIRMLKKEHSQSKTELLLINTQSDRRKNDVVA